jgi:hypothetical protein
MRPKDQPVSIDTLLGNRKESLLCVVNLLQGEGRPNAQMEIGQQIVPGVIRLSLSIYGPKARNVGLDDRRMGALQAIPNRSGSTCPYYIYRT